MADGSPSPGSKADLAGARADLAAMQANAARRAASGDYGAPDPAREAATSGMVVWTDYMIGAIDPSGQGGQISPHQARDNVARAVSGWALQRYVPTLDAGRQRLVAEALQPDVISGRLPWLLKRMIVHSYSLGTRTEGEVKLATNVRRLADATGVKVPAKDSGVGRFAIEMMRHAGARLPRIHTQQVETSMHHLETIFGLPHPED